MSTNLDRFKQDLTKLINTGRRLKIAMQLRCFPEKTKESIEKQLGDGGAKLIKELPSFTEQYQRWYSEALALLRQLLPDRLVDFTRHYEKPKGRKDITYANYCVEDYLQGLNVSAR